MQCAGIWASGMRHEARQGWVGNCSKIREKILGKFLLQSTLSHVDHLNESKINVF